MNKPWMATLTTLACLLPLSAAKADGWLGGHCKGYNQSRTYFGWPGSGEQQNIRYQNPWAVKFLGIPCCKSDCDKYQKFLLHYQIVNAKYQTHLNSLCWKKYDNYVNRQNSGCMDFAGECDINPYSSSRKLVKLKDGHKHGHQAGPYCADYQAACEADCGIEQCGGQVACGPQGCDGCDAGCAAGKGGHFADKPSLKEKCANFFAKHRKPAYPVQRPEAYPAMNREDAVRYIEGFQYYPPTHIMRSPRDFYMFDVKYGVGR